MDVNEYRRSLTAPLTLGIDLKIFRLATLAGNER